MPCARPPRQHRVDDQRSRERRSPNSRSPNSVESASGKSLADTLTLAAAITGQSELMTTARCPRSGRRLHPFGSGEAQPACRPHPPGDHTDGGASSGMRRASAETAAVTPGIQKSSVTNRPSYMARQPAASTSPASPPAGPAVIPHYPLTLVPCHRRPAHGMPHLIVAGGVGLGLRRVGDRGSQVAHPSAPSIGALVGVVSGADSRNYGLNTSSSRSLITLKCLPLPVHKARERSTAVAAIRASAMAMPSLRACSSR